MSVSYEINFNVMSYEGGGYVMGSRSSGTGVSASKTKPGKMSIMSMSTIVRTANNPVTSLIKGVGKAAGGGAIVGSVLVALKVAETALTYTTDISAMNTGDYAGSLSWNNFMTNLSRFKDPIKTIMDDIKTNVKDEKRNREIGFQRELYGMADGKKGA